MVTMDSPVCSSTSSARITRTASLGYRQVIDFLNGKQHWERTVELIKRETWLYAKRQMTWFAADQEINWYPAELSAEIAKKVEAFLKGFPAGVVCNIT